MNDNEKFEVLENLYDRDYDYGVRDTLESLSDLFGEEAIQMTEVRNEVHK